ncbi:polysaccharide lyase 6 family protein [Croceicoccus sp. Ery15]|uniref:polysaccharide lyase 6 family protein n=1 Tax=Croceicoccus sp. Ery15 TaxID=1703338 RepID=UPI001E305D02|nr:polysaccharide lyase 6 family protein [Croceicoccus sp. Ery15]
MLARYGIGVALTLAIAAPLHAEEFFVRNQNEYAHALKGVEAGDIIILANGEWKDFDLVITGKGTAKKPITVISEEAGKVFLTGQSSLRIGGEHILVTGLVFKDGYSPRGEVISFRRSKDDQARNSRVTEVVIDHFSKPDRTDDDYWVGIYGKNNRFDHNSLVGKTNKGVTLAVRLDSAESRDNGHRIDHNYFGPRPVLGSNGGETIRIGTSQYSMYNSGTIVENNIFDRCDGEVEIVSNKSGGNIYRGNLFLRSRGTLTLRHGDGNLVESNVFLGHSKDYTGGIRVINRDQIVRGNYMEGLRGTGFSSALTVMNGVPNSPVNRYVQVENAQIERNTVIDSARVTLGAGADDERSAPPVKSVMRANLLGGLDSGTFVEVDADISGIQFADNAVIKGDVHSDAAALRRVDTEMARAGNGLLYPADPALAEIGAPRDLKVMPLAEVGPDWWPKPEAEAEFASGTTTMVPAGEGTLADAAASAATGDVLQLAAGEYGVDQAIAVTKVLTIKGAGADTVIRFTRPSLFDLQQGGNLQLQNLSIDGSMAPDSVGNSVIRTGSFPIQSNLIVEMDGVSVSGLTVNKSFNVLTIGKSVLADRIAIRGSSFADITGTIVSASAETDDYGLYNVEYLDIVDSRFANVGEAVANVYRGGTDESTFGPSVTFTGNTLANIGKAATNAEGASLYLHGVQTADVARNTVTGSAPFKVVHTVGTPVTRIRDNSFAKTPAPVVTELNYEGLPRAAMQGNSVDGKAL